MMMSSCGSEPTPIQQFKNDFNESMRPADQMEEPGWMKVINPQNLERRGNLQFTTPQLHDK